MKRNLLGLLLILPGAWARADGRGEWATAFRNRVGLDFLQKNAPTGRPTEWQIAFRERVGLDFLRHDAPPRPSPVHERFGLDFLRRR